MKRQYNYLQVGVQCMVGTLQMHCTTLVLQKIASYIIEKLISLLRVDLT